MTRRSTGAAPILHHVKGAPFQVGQDVRVVCSVEEPESGCGVPEFVGKAGRVVSLEYACGCGQRYPADPMIAVDFGDGTEQEFWAEELTMRAPDALVKP